MGVSADRDNSQKDLITSVTPAVVNYWLLTISTVQHAVGEDVMICEQAQLRPLNTM